jgi:predicted Zn-dependent protease
MPGERFRLEQLELLNGLYPKREPQAGEPLKIVE